MKAFQCSRCVQLQQDDLSDKVFCPFAQPVPRYRDKSDRELCLAAFKSLPPERQWHERLGGVWRTGPSSTLGQSEDCNRGESKRVPVRVRPPPELRFWR